MAKIFFNGRRLYQAIALGAELATYTRKVIVDGEEIAKPFFTATDHRILEHLGRMMATKTEGTTVEDTCFPSIQSISLSTMYCEKQVRKSIGKLVETGFLSKTVIPGRAFHKNSGKLTNGNAYDGCRYHVTAKWDSIKTPFDGLSIGPKHPLPAADLTPTADDIEGAASIDRPRDPDQRAASPEPAPAQLDARPAVHDPERHKKDHERIFAYLKEHFGDHPTMRDENAPRLVGGAIKTALELAGGAELVMGTIEYILNEDEQAARNVRTSRNLGGYLRASLGGWVSWFAHAWTDAYLPDLHRGGNQIEWYLCQDDDDRKLEQSFRFALGRNLQSFLREKKEDHQWCWTFTVTEEFADQWRATHPPVEGPPPDHGNGYCPEPTEEQWDDEGMPRFDGNGKLIDRRAEPRPAVSKRDREDDEEDDMVERNPELR